jgi:hypothetical protein
MRAAFLLLAALCFATLAFGLPVEQPASEYKSETEEPSEDTYENDVVSEDLGPAAEPVYEPRDNKESVAAVAKIKSSTSKKTHCALNSIFKECGSAHPAYCNEKGEGFSISKCVAGCFCMDGYILQDANSSLCIFEAQCPNPSPLHINEVHHASEHGANHGDSGAH